MKKDMSQRLKAFGSSGWRLKTFVSLCLSFVAGLDGLYAFNITAEQLKKDQEQRLKSAEETLQNVLKVKGERTVGNTLEPFLRMGIALSNGSASGSLMSNVHPDADVRAQARQVRQEISTFYQERFQLNPEVYAAYQAVKLPKNAEPGLAYYLASTLESFRRSGVDKDEKTRKKIAALRADIVKASQEFRKNLSSDVRSITVPVARLAGMPQDYIDARLGEKSNAEPGHVKITTNYPDYMPFMSYSSDTEMKEQLFKKNRKRGYPENKEPLEQLLSTRYELAQLLGYKNWAEYATSDKMIQNAGNVRRFLDGLDKISQDGAKRFYQALLTRKQKEQPKAKVVQPWETIYLRNLLKKESIDFDPLELRPYFSYVHVKRGVFQITEKLFGWRIEPISGRKVWHPSVEAYAVFEGETKLGEFYLDMHPRKDKFKHAAQFTLQPGVKGYQVSIPVLVCNFPEPTATDPGLMEHGQVETFLHEFGHLIHSIMRGQNTWHGNEEWDFVEAPSQLLEEWVYDLATLQGFARHHETGKVIPKSLVDKLLKARRYGQNASVAGQLYFANLSLEIYQAKPKDLNIDRLSQQLYERFLHTPYYEGSKTAYGFGHLTGYASNYYTYLWSLTISKDMFAQFKKKGLYSKPLAKAFLNKVLKGAGQKPSQELIEDFLGRPFSAKAFEDDLSREFAL